MPVRWCLPPSDADEFKRGIISGEIDPLKLAEMNSKQRRAFFANWFGDSTGAAMNLEFEKSLLLKNQQQGMVNWAKKIMAKDPARKRDDMISRIQKLDKVLDAKDEDAFLADLAAQKLGVGVSFDEAKKISDMSKKVEDAREKMAAGGDRMIYGRAVVELQNYVADLKKEASSQPMSYYAAHPVQAAKAAIGFVGGNSKSILSSLDNSALLRQGLPTLLSHPGVWQKNARKSFVDLVRAFGSDQVLNETMAEIVSRPSYDLMRRSGTAIGSNEEAFPESLPEKIPVIGRAFRASEHTYQAFLRRTRADLFDMYARTWKKAGFDLSHDDHELRAIGAVVNSLTGRAHLGKFEMIAEPLNKLMFSPRMMKSKWDVLTAHMLDPQATPFARKQAALNLFKALVAVGVLLAIAKAANENSVDFDLTGPTFGKVSHRTRTRADVLLSAMADALGVTTNSYKHKDTTYDLTGGHASYISLAARITRTLARLAMGSHKKDRRDTWQDVENFIENKTAPVPSAIRDTLRERDFSGQKPTIPGTIEKLAVPLPIQNYIEQEGERKRNAGK